MKATYNPYSLSFPRRKFLDPFLSHGTSFVHPLKRSAFLSYFQAKNHDGYHHDLGTQDVFLDNFGTPRMRERGRYGTLRDRSPLPRSGGGTGRGRRRTLDLATP